MRETLQLSWLMQGVCIAVGGVRTIVDSEDIVGPKGDGVDERLAWVRRCWSCLQRLCGSGIASTLNVTSHFSSVPTLFNGLPTSGNQDLMYMIHELRWQNSSNADAESAARATTGFDGVHAVGLTPSVRALPLKEPAWASRSAAVPLSAPDCRARSNKFSTRSFLSSRPLTTCTAP